jgi:hypothetical protein
LRLPRFQVTRHVKVVSLAALRTGLLYPQGSIPGTQFCNRLSRPRGHNASGNVMTITNSYDTIWNRTRGPSAHVQTGPGAHPPSCTMGIGSFPGVKRPGRGVDHPPPPSAEVENE